MAIKAGAAKATRPSRSTRSASVQPRTSVWTHASIDSNLAVPPTGQGSLYSLTDAGADLVDVIDSLGRWAETWVEVLPEHADPGFTLWAWCQVQLNRELLPDRRIVVHFDFPEERPGDRFFWLLIDNGEAEVCTTDPGGDPDLSVVAGSRVFVDWHRGTLSWDRARRGGGIVVTGSRSLVSAFPTWNTRVPVLVG